MFDGQPDDADDEHGRRVDHAWLVQPDGCLHQHVAGDDEQERGVGERGEDLQAVETERSVVGLLGPVGSAVGSADRGERHSHAECVGGHVPGVGEQRQRVSGQAHHDLHDEEDDDQSERAP